MTLDGHYKEFTQNLLPISWMMRLSPMIKTLLKPAETCKDYEDYKKIWELERDPYLLETSCAGIFAAGDVRAGAMNRVASAVGEGSMAISFVHKYLGRCRESLENRNWG